MLLRLAGFPTTFLQPPGFYSTRYAPFTTTTTVPAYYPVWLLPATCAVMMKTYASGSLPFASSPLFVTTASGWFDDTGFPAHGDTLPQFWTTH